MSPLQEHDNEVTPEMGMSAPPNCYWRGNKKIQNSNFGMVKAIMLWVGGWVKSQQSDDKNSLAIH